MTTKFTPGPWSVELSRERKSDIRGWREIWAGRVPVVDTDGATIRRQGEEFCEHGTRISEANAALISAAPDLYKALEEAREYVERAYECAFPDEQQNASVLAAIDAALAKARGEDLPNGR